MFLAIILLLFAIGTAALLIALLSAGAIASQWWVYTLLGVVSLCSLLGGLYKLEDETFCFSDLADFIRRKKAQKKEPESRKAVTGDSKKKSDVKASWITTNIVFGVLELVAFTVYAAAYLFLFSAIYDGKQVSGFNLIGIIVSVCAFGFAKTIPVSRFL